MHETLQVDFKRDTLLRHPLVKAYLKSEWNVFGRWVYFLQVILYMLFLGCFSTLTQVIPHPIEEQYSKCALVYVDQDCISYAVYRICSIFFLCVTLLKISYKFMTEKSNSQYLIASI